MTENLDALNLDDHYICFPAGGAFNKLRATSRNSLYLDQLLDDCQPGYMASRKKRAYVQEHILNHIPGGLKIWKGKSPWKGYLVTMDDHEAYEKIAQVMRDRRKTRRFSRVSSSPTTTTTTPPPPSTRPDLVLRPHRRSPRKPVKTPPAKVPTVHKKTKKGASRASPSSRKRVQRPAAADTPTPMTTIPETEDASVHNIDTLKEQLIWSQKQELDRLRHAFDSQKEMIAIQQQQIQVLEANLFEALLRANSHIYLQHVAVETSDTTPEEQVQQPTRDDNHLDDMDDATAAKDIHEEEDEDNNDDDPDEQQHMAHV